MTMIGLRLFDYCTTRHCSLYRDTRRLCVLITLMMFVVSADSCFPGGQLIRRMPKKEPAFLFHQHFPNVPENSVTASGPREGRIRREDRRFKELVANHNSDIIFKDEKGTGADRMMSLRCKEKLDALAMLVANYWPNVKLRVTEGWAEDNIFRHPVDSLHLEGRAVDITTSDRDRDKYGMLARLAAQAGFDWVHFEQRGHIHASVKSDTVTRNKRMLRCFPSSSTVISENGVNVPMSDLKIGSRVATMSAKGTVAYSPVIAFLHVNSSSRNAMLQVFTQSGASLMISSDHILYKVQTNSALPTAHASSQFLTPVFADQLEVGDEIFVKRINSSILSLDKIMQISSVLANGLYAPLTLEGSLIVDGVLTSCYAAVRSENVAHFVMSPLRLYWRLVDYSKRLYGIQYLYERFSNIPAEGVHWYAELLLVIADLLDKFNVHQFLNHI